LKLIPHEIRYNSSFISFFLPTRPNKGTVERISTNYICREEYVDMFKMLILKQLKCKFQDQEYDEYDEDDLKCCTRKAYIGISSGANTDRKPFIDSMMCALDVINVLEEKHGWPLTVLYETTKQNSVIFCGTNKWIKSPFALSLYTLLMRLGETGTTRDMYDRIPNKYKRYDLFVNTMRRLKLRKRVYNYEDGRTIKRVLETIKYWDLFIKEYDTIFKRRSFLSNYGYRSVNEWYRKSTGSSPDHPPIYASETDGISNLVFDKAVDLEICRRFKKLMENI